MPQPEFRPLAAEDLQTLSAFSPIDRLSADELTELAPAAEVVRAAKGAVLFREGDTDPFNWYLLSGRLGLTAAGRQLDELDANAAGSGAGVTFGGSLPRRITAHCLTAVRALRVDTERLRELLDRHDSISSPAPGEVRALGAVDDGRDAISRIEVPPPQGDTAWPASQLTADGLPEDQQLLALELAALRQETYALEASLQARQRELADADKARLELEDALEDAHRKIDRLRKELDSVAITSEESEFARKEAEQARDQLEHAVLQLHSANHESEALDLRDERLLSRWQGIEVSRVIGDNPWSTVVAVVLGALLVLIGLEILSLALGRGELFSALFGQP